LGGDWVREIEIGKIMKQIQEEAKMEKAKRRGYERNMPK
jgi:hypothetical protein